MTKDFIERYNNFNTKGCPDDLVFGYFNHKPISSTYSGFINDYDDYGTPIGAALADNEGVEDAVVTNDEDPKLKK